MRPRIGMLFAVAGLLAASARMPMVSTTRTVPTNWPEDRGRRAEKDQRKLERAQAKRAMRAAKRAMEAKA